MKRKKSADLQQGLKVIVLDTHGYKLGKRDQKGARKQVVQVYRAWSRGKLVSKTAIFPSPLTQTCNYENR